MTIETTATVGDLAAKLPQATRVLEQFGIDYCCGGGQTLADACRFKAVDAQEVVRAIEESLKREQVARNLRRVRPERTHRPYCQHAPCIYAIGNRATHG